MEDEAAEERNKAVEEKKEAAAERRVLGALKQMAESVGLEHSIETQEEVEYCGYCGAEWTCEIAHDPKDSRCYMNGQKIVSCVNCVLSDLHRLHPLSGQNRWVEETVGYTTDNYHFGGVLHEQLRFVRDLFATRSGIHVQELQNHPELQAEVECAVECAVQEMWCLPGIDSARKAIAALEDRSAFPKTLLVIGQSGSGKSSLIGACMKGEDESSKPHAAAAVTSVTKHQRVFETTIDGELVLMIDSPGFGDTTGDAAGFGDVDIWKQVRTVLEVPGLIDGVLVVESANFTRISPGVTTMMRMLDQISCHPSIWSKVLVVATKMDEASTADEWWTSEGQNLVHGKEREYLEERYEFGEVPTKADTFKHKFFHHFRTEHGIEPVLANMGPVQVGDRSIRAAGRKIPLPEDLKTLFDAVKGLDRSLLPIHKIGDLYLSKIIKDTYDMSVPEAEIITHVDTRISDVAKWHPLSLLGLGVAGWYALGVVSKLDWLVPLVTTQEVTLTVNLKSSLHTMCAALSSLTYLIAERESQDDAQRTLFCTMRSLFPNEDIVHANVLNFDKKDMGTMLSSIVTSDRTMIVAYRGSAVMLDWVTNALATPTPSQHWNKIWPNIHVHMGMNATVLDSIMQFLPQMFKVIKQMKVRSVVFTGHSLGGGLAQIALAIALAKQCAGNDSLEGYFPEDLEAPTVEEALNLCKNTNFSAITFAAPMVLHYNEDDLGPAEVKIIHDLVDKGCNYVSFDDMVPRMPGHYQFWQQALNDLLCHTIEQKAGHILGSLIEMAALPKVHELLDKANKALTTLKNFKHVLQQKVVRQVTRNGAPPRVEIKNETPIEFAKIAYLGSCGDKLLDYHSFLPGNVITNGDLPINRLITPSVWESTQVGSIHCLIPMRLPDEQEQALCDMDADEMRLASGASIVVHGLKERPRFNGKNGVVLEVMGSGRYSVLIDDAVAPIALKQANLQLCQPNEHHVEAPAEHHVGATRNANPNPDLDSLRSRVQNHVKAKRRPWRYNYQYPDGSHSPDGVDLNITACAVLGLDFEQK